jgi:hypothetical protein
MGLKHSFVCESFKNLLKINNPLPRKLYMQIKFFVKCPMKFNISYNSVLPGPMLALVCISYVDVILKL